MVCLFHGDYGPADPAFSLGPGSTWVIDVNSLTKARNLGEAEAIQRHLLRGEKVTTIMRGRFAGVIGSAILSTLSVMLFFYPGLNLGVDFRGGGVVELHGPRALQVDTIREAFAPLGFRDLRVQEFGSPQDVLVRFENKAQLQDAQRMIASRVAEALPGVQIRRTEVVGARVSSELFRNGLLATGLALVAVLVYIWFRFEWQFGVGVVATLILDITKTVGFFAVTLALIGGQVMRGFGLAIIFGIVIGTSSSIFIASPILLFLGEKRLRPSQARTPQATVRAIAP